jgi:hypothetical protein
MDLLTRKKDLMALVLRAEKLIDEMDVRGERSEQGNQQESQHRPHFPLDG